MQYIDNESVVSVCVINIIVTVSNLQIYIESSALYVDYPRQITVCYFGVYIIVPYTSMQLFVMYYQLSATMKVMIETPQ